jgi:hypothetical protein
MEVLVMLDNAWKRRRRRRHRPSPLATDPKAVAKSSAHAPAYCSTGRVPSAGLSIKPAAGKRSAALPYAKHARTDGQTLQPSRPWAAWKAGATPFASAAPHAGPQSAGRTAARESKRASRPCSCHPASRRCHTNTGAPGATYTHTHTHTRGGRRPAATASRPLAAQQGAQAGQSTRDTARNRVRPPPTAARYCTPGISRAPSQKALRRRPGRLATPRRRVVRQRERHGSLSRCAPGRGRRPAALTRGATQGPRLSPGFPPGLYSLIRNSTPRRSLTTSYVTNAMAMDGMTCTRTRRTRWGASDRLPHGTWRRLR